MNEVKKKKRLSKAGLIIIIGISIIAIPCLVFAGILGKAYLQNGSPRDGSRFDGDLVNEINSDKLDEINKDLNTISGLDSVDVVLSEGQLKIFVDVKDSATQEECESIVNTVYTKVTSKLPVNTYFTKTDVAKMYDLQIHVYTTIESSEIGASNPRTYYLLNKNSAAEEYQLELLSQPKDVDMARELEGYTQEVEDNTTETDGE